MPLWNIDVFKTIHPEFDLVETNLHSKEWLQYMLFHHRGLHGKYWPTPQPPAPIGILHLTAACISGPISRTITAPFDRLRIAIQIAEKKQTIKQTLEELYKEGGIRSLWRGNLVNVIKVAPEILIRFGIYERIKRYLRSKPGKRLSILEKCMSAAAAGVIGQIFIYPLDVLKTMLAIGKTGEYKGIIDVTIKAYAMHGLTGFYRGFTPSAIGVIPYTGIDITTFEALKNQFVYKSGTLQDIKNFDMVLRVMACGTVSTALAQFAAYPFQLIKSRQQAGSKHPSNTISDDLTWRFCDLCQIMYVIMKTEGIRGLYRGLVPSLCRVLPACAINYTAYEYVYQVLIIRFPLS